MEITQDVFEELVSYKFKYQMAIKVLEKVRTSETYNSHEIIDLFYKDEMPSRLYETNKK